MCLAPDTFLIAVLFVGTVRSEYGRFGIVVVVASNEGQSSLPISLWDLQAQTDEKKAKGLVQASAAKCCQ